MNRNNSLITSFNKHNAKTKKDSLSNNELISNNVVVSNRLKQELEKKKKLGSSRNNSSNNILNEFMAPQKVDKNSSDIENRYKKLETEYQTRKTGKIIPEKFDNTPYKCIITEESIRKREIRDKKDIVVHVVTEKDRDRTDFENKRRDKESKIEQINKELERNYTTDKFEENKKRFNHKYDLIRNCDYLPQTFDTQKEESIDYYKEIQRKEEEKRMKCDDILKTLQEAGVINEEEIPRFV